MKFIVIENEIINVNYIRYVKFSDRKKLISIIVNSSLDISLNWTFDEEDYIYYKKMIIDNLIEEDEYCD